VARNFANAKSKYVGVFKDNASFNIRTTTNQNINLLDIQT